MAKLLASIAWDWSLVWTAIGVSVAYNVVKFFYRLHQVRSMVREIPAKYGIPIMPHSYLFGHLISVAKVMMKQPSDVFGGCAPLFIMKAYPELAECGAMYMDMWPISPPMLTVFDPDMMAQFCQEPSLPKAELMHTEFGPFTQLKDLVNLEGQDWKRWRGVFNPGFSAKNLLSLVPTFLEEIEVFTDHLRSLAKSGEIVRFEEPAMDLTIDVIGRAALGARLHAQTKHNGFRDAMNKQVYWLETDRLPRTIVKLLNPLRPVMMWLHNRTMKNYFMPLIEQSMAEHTSQDTGTTSGGPKTIISLATKAYLSDPALRPADAKPTHIDAEFLNVLISQLKIFMFAGHDTTATALAFAYHFLHTNPHTLAALRAEHTAVFGPNPATAAAQIAANPSLLNALPYTLAVIKETLRLFPPVGSVREGQRDLFLTNLTTGARYPTAGWMLFSCSFASQRWDAVWPRAGEFVPERWLAREGDPLHVRKNAFRPFELGPRNCIGQELALLEIKAIMVLTLREMKFESCFGQGAQAVLGDVAYQVQGSGQVTGHPKGGMPMRVRLRTGE
ncbi:cytochrome P450 [Podospora appendiculata]|uniref:Cytochrome P450 n=1 Tax=Podospora appendiculata TaxID=314037 RepID=A0AAE0X8Z9_9PEZI|nr:cytochrome P450 [Podospora appendiculata]